RPLDALQPCHLVRRVAAAGLRRLRIAQQGKASLLAARLLAARAELHRLDAPADLLDFVPLRRVPGGFHRRVDAVAQDDAVLLGAVVVLARRDVSGAASEVDLEDAAIVGLALLAGEAAEVAAD